MAEGSRPLGVLFLCTGNSARSIFAECLLRRLGEGRFAAYSAGSRPKPAPHPMALRLLAERGHAIEALRSKSWEECAAPAAPRIDFIVTVCDNAAGESCPVWPGNPVSAHWGVPDPAAVAAPDAAVREAFERAYEQLEARVRAFVALPLAELEGAALLERLCAIGTPGKE
jgi:arsenate reductase